MSYEIVTTLTYTEVGKHFPSFTGKCFDIFFNFFKMYLYCKILNILKHVAIFVYSNYLLWKITAL